MRYQIGQRWFIGARYDYSEFPENSEVNETAYSGILSFFATEFQKIELQYQYGIPAEGKSFNRILLRAVFVIGAHGAHKY
jgi:peroxiredoxin